MEREEILKTLRRDIDPTGDAVDNVHLRAPGDAIAVWAGNDNALDRTECRVWFIAEREPGCRGRNPWQRLL